MKGIGWKLVLLIILAALVFLWLIKAPIIASYLTKKMRVPVSIERISIWPSETTMLNFKIRNPKGFKSRVAFEAENTRIDYRFKELFSDPIAIDQIILDKIFLGVEFSNPFGTSNNWTEIGKNMPQQKSQKRLIIHKLVLTDLSVEIQGLGLLGKPTTKTLSRLEFDDIDSAQGFPTEELVKKVFGGSGIQQFLQDAFNS